ncbi:MAG TPA: 50S ribosomal protein L4 [Candidatus Paceibacterota bacterium]|nr:50S ribosomal protein L4 [Candidatus Paceibacterota bacterium]
MKTDVYNLKNEKVGEMELPASVFGAKWNPTLVKQALEAQLANKRRPWAHAKTRAEVRGGGRKPWRQKGTGRARHGSTRSPLWVGGGKAHGPSKLRDYSQKINKKMNRIAIFSVLSQKLKDGEIKVFENLTIEAPKTKVLASVLVSLLAMKKNRKNFDALLVTGSANENVARASANLPKAKMLRPESLNVYDIVNHKNIFLEKEAVAAIDKRYKL